LTEMKVDAPLWIPLERQLNVFFVPWEGWPSACHSPVSSPAEDATRTTGGAPFSTDRIRTCTPT